MEKRKPKREIGKMCEKQECRECRWTACKCPCHKEIDS